MFEIDSTPAIQALSVLCAVLLALLKQAFTFLRDCELTTLCFLAAIFHIATHSRFGPHPAVSRSPWVRRVGLACFLAFGLAAFWARGDGELETTEYVGLGIRGLLVMVIVEGMTAILFAILSYPTSAIDGVVKGLQWGLSRLFIPIVALSKWRPKPRPLPPPPPPPSPRQVIDELKRDYREACELLQNAGLDEDELDAAVEYERQKLVARMYDVFRR